MTLPSGTRTSLGSGMVGLLSLRSTMMTVRVAEPASRGDPLSVAMTTSLEPHTHTHTVVGVSVCAAFCFAFVLSPLHATSLITFHPPTLFCCSRQTASRLTYYFPAQTAQSFTLKQECEQSVPYGWTECEPDIPVLTQHPTHTHTHTHTPDRHKPRGVSLCVCPDLSIHDGCRGDAAGHRVDLKQAAHGGRAEGVAHLAVLTLVQVVRKHLRKLPLSVKKQGKKI